MNQCDVHPAALQVDRLLDQCDLRRRRCSGPGGQHRNKVETGVVIRHRPTGIEAAATERRSQEQNRRMAIRRLRIKLALQLRSPQVATGEPSRLWQTRCRGGRIAIGRNHDDFPVLLTEALDQMMACKADLAAAARRLNCTRSQLTKLLKTVPEAIGQVNRHREQLGLKPLR